MVCVLLCYCFFVVAVVSCDSFLSCGWVLFRDCFSLCSGFLLYDACLCCSFFVVWLLFALLLFFCLVVAVLLLWRPKHSRCMSICVLFFCWVRSNCCACEQQRSVLFSVVARKCMGGELVRRHVDNARVAARVKRVQEEDCSRPWWQAWLACS